MEGLQRWGAARGCGLDPPDIPFQQPSARLNALSISEEQSSEITIATAEGDTVILSSRQHAEADLLTYQHLVCIDCGYNRENMRLVDFEAERELTVTVQGHLNDQELADIQALLRDLGGLLKAFLTGEDESDAALEGAGGLGRFGTLSAVKADFEYHVSRHYLNFESNQLIAQRAGTPKRLVPVEAEAAIGPLPPDSTPARVLAAAAGRTTAAHEGSGTGVEQAAAKMAKRAHESGLPGLRRLQHLKQFLKNFLEEMLANQVLDVEQTRLGQRVIERFMNALQKPADGAEVRMRRTGFNLQVIGRAYEVTSQASLGPGVVESA